jgi:hypothetical protein
MRATPTLESAPLTLAEMLVHHITTSADARRAHSATRVLRRRPSPSQGRALETLGHAIEYLIDMRMRRDSDASPWADMEAEQLMMRLNREVFAECTEVVPIGGPMDWLGRVLRKV